LRSAGVEVLEHHVSVWDEQRHKFSPGMRALVRSIAAETRLAFASRQDADVLIVGYPGHLDVPAAKRASRGRPVVLNPLVSLGDTMIDDRGLVHPGSLKARTLHAVDRTAFRRADLVVSDTFAHAGYFRERFGLAPERVAVCYVGAEDRLFHPNGRERADNHVLFVGKLIPLHGVDTILEAAALCPGITFHIVGSGQLDALLERRTANVRWDPWMEYEELPDLYRSATCALGIFGVSAKASRVIPNKAFHALATGTPLITADTPAARELVEHERDALLVDPGDPRALAEAVQRLTADATVRSGLATRGRQTYEAHASEEALGKRWRGLLERLLDERLRS
jgi:glycosyltransferase involved in cell wall biosynthesis